MKFAVGDKVVEKKHTRAHTSYPVSVVVGTLNGALLIEPWGDGFDSELHHYDFYSDDKPGSRHWREGITRVQENELFTPEEALEEIKRLEAVKSKLEEEFGAVHDLIAANLKQAAELVQTAAGLTTKCDKDFEDLTHECEPLYRALEAGGWRHSTMVCKFGR